MGYFSAVLDWPIAIAESAIADETASLYPGETASLVAAVPRRRAEFSTGRKCARAAMAQLGISAQALLPQPDRTPLWPEGITGSITHTLQHCAAAVGRRSDGIEAIGIDLEPATSLPEGLWENICSADELAAAEAAGYSAALAPRLLFGAKEAAFKAQFLLSRTMLEFSDLELEFEPSAAKYTAIFKRDVPQFAKGSRLGGRLRIADGHIACAVVVVKH